MESKTGSDVTPVGETAERREDSSRESSMEVNHGESSETSSLRQREGTPLLTLTADGETEELSEIHTEAAGKSRLKKVEDDDPHSGRSTPSVFFEDEGGEVEVFDLPPQFMVCRRNSATIINIPRAKSIGLPPQATMDEVQEEDEEEEPPEPGHEEVPLRTSSSSRPLLRRAEPVAEEDEPPGGGTQDVFKVPEEVIYSRMSSAPLMQKQRSLLGLDGRLSRSLEDLQRVEGAGGRFRVTHAKSRRTSTPGVPFRRHKPIPMRLRQQSLDVHYMRRQPSIDEDGSLEPLHVVEGKRKSTGTLFYRQSSGATLPFHYPLDVSHEEIEEDLDEGPELENEETLLDASLQRQSSVATAFHRNAAGRTLCLPAQYSLDLLDSDISEDFEETLPEVESLAEDRGESFDDVDGSVHSEPKSRKNSTTVLQRKGSVAIPLFRELDDSFSESYFAVKGAALILPQSECPRTVTRGTHGGDIQTHLQSMFYLLRPHDTIKVAVKLESVVEDRNRYMAVVSTTGRQDTEESVILGIDIINEKATIGLVLPIWGDTSITLDGDGGFKVTSFERHHIFKPVSVQAMWSALQSLIKARDIAQQHHYYPRGLTHTWVTYYETNVSSDQMAINEWNTMEDIESHRPDPLLKESLEKIEVERLIKVKLKEIMLTVDLEEVTSKYLRTRLEEEMDICLKDKRQFIDEEMIVILRQMDSASEIFPFLYLGSEWNASNLEELKDNGIGHILNVTREIDNFFPGMFDYSNIRVYDVEQAELLKHWDNTFKFITKARNKKSKVLVHCKMGVSRSASTVIAYAMKEYGWNLEEAFKFVKEHRSCIRPNKGFMQQLITYEGILDASKQRNNKLFRSRSEGNLENSPSPQTSLEESATLSELLDYQGYPNFDPSRPRSWSPEDSATELLMKTHDLASEGDSTGDKMPTDLTETISGFDDRDVSCSFIPWDDDIDDFIESSRSADSIDDILYDDTSYKRLHNEDAPPGDSIVLLSYRALSESHCDLAETCDQLDDLTSDGELEEPLVFEPPGKVARGFYDVKMLESLGEVVHVDDYYDSENTAATSDQINYFLHPDVKMELLMAQQRKNMRVAQMLKKSQPPQMELGIQEEPVKRDTRPLSQTLPPCTPSVGKLRADNSWIKEIPPSPQGSVPDNDEEAEDEEMLIPETEESNGAAVAPEPEPMVPRPQEETASSAVTCEQEELKSPAEQLVAEESTPKSSSETTPSSEDGSSREMSTMHHYEKEAIPWNPGTVRKHKQHLENRIKSDLRTKEEHSSRHSGSSSSESGGSTEDLESEEEQPVKLTVKRCDIPMEEAVVFISGAEVGETSTDDQPPEEAMVSSTKTVSDQVCDSVDSQEAETDSALKPSSIYEMEDIAVEPGVVKRTLQEIESRESRTTPSPDKEIKQVQRSSSLKNDRSKKDRNSERRRTCTPVLRTEGQDQELSVTVSAGDSTMDSDDSVHVLQLGQETIEVVAGRVKQHKDAIESRKSEVETEGDSQKSEPDTPPTSPLEDTVTDCMKQRSQSLPINTNVEIPTGSVRKQKQELELRLSQPATSGAGQVTTDGIKVKKSTPGGASVSRSSSTGVEPGEGRRAVKLSGGVGKPVVSSSEQKFNETATDPADGNIEHSSARGDPVCGRIDGAKSEAAPVAILKGEKNSANSKCGTDLKTDLGPSLPSVGVGRQASWKSSKSKVSSPKHDSTPAASKGSESPTKPPAASGINDNGDNMTETMQEMDRSNTCLTPAYPETDITWSVGMVRQQKEAIEKGSTGSPPVEGSTTLTATEVAPPSGTHVNEGQTRASLTKDSHLPSVLAVKAEDPNISAVSRSSSFKENVTGSSKTEFSNSQSKAPLRGGHNKDVLMSTEQRLNSSEKTLGSLSPALSTNRKSFTAKKEVLILEAKNGNATSKQQSPPALVKTPPGDNLANPSVETEEMRERTPEEKKVASLVGIFEQKEQEEKEKEKSSPSPQEYKPEKPVKIITSSDLAAAAATSTGGSAQRPQGSERTGGTKKVKDQVDPGQGEVKDSVGGGSGVLRRSGRSGSGSLVHGKRPPSLPGQKTELGRKTSLPVLPAQTGPKDQEEVARRASWIETQKAGSAVSPVTAGSAVSPVTAGSAVSPVTAGSAVSPGTAGSLGTAETKVPGGELRTKSAVQRVPINTSREPALGEGPRKSRKLHGKSHPLAKLTAAEMGRNAVPAFNRDRTGRSNNPVYNTM